MKEAVRTWLVIDCQALKNNYRLWRRLAGGAKLLAVVKSNAYGHGLVYFSKILQKMGIDWLGVDSITEALALRKSGIKKSILVLGFTVPQNFAAAAKNDISLTISSFDNLKNLFELKRRPKIHLKIDTGMHRQGFLPQDAPRLLKILKEDNLGIGIEGVYTHFAAAKNPAFPQSTLEQINKFSKATVLFEAAGFRPLKHAAATAGILLFPQARFDLVRVGIGMYGLWPSKEAKMVFSRSVRLKPVLSWKTIVSEVKGLTRGSKIGYDLTEALIRDSTVAVCPVGYWHGLPRCLSSIGEVLVKGRRARILGRVSMDMIAIDVTDAGKVRAGEEVTLIGKDGAIEISADDLASLADTNNYEIVTRLNPLMKRYYL